LILVATVLAPRLMLTLPYSKFTIEFSDFFIFLTFLLQGGKAAILIATIQSLASCLYLKKRGVNFGKYDVPLNIASSALTTTITFTIILTFSSITSINYQTKELKELFTILGILTLSQFFVGNIILFYLHNDSTNNISWSKWKNIYFSTSITHIIGAASAGLFYKILSSYSYINLVLAIAIYTILYLSYRQIIKNTNESISKAEKAEKERIESERRRAEEAEANLARLSILFAEQEKISQDLKQSKEALEKTAYYDSLTQIPNRTYLIERLELLIDLGIDIAHKYYVLFIDLHRFKNINDSLGHPIGDKVLVLVAKRLKHILREEDTIARLGGDEFAVILNDLTSLTEAENFARRIHKKLSQPFSVDGHTIYSGLHIGVAPLETDHLKPDDVLRDADIAMHHAKAHNLPVSVFNKDLRKHFLETIKLEADLRFAVKRDELTLYYQPIISLETGELAGFEALVRWQHPKYGFISPGQFIPIAEDSGLIIHMTRWILREACMQLAQWQKISPVYSDLKVSVNISGKHLAVEDLPGQVKRAVNASGIRPSTLSLEITESSAMENAEHTIAILDKIRKLGVRLSIDDFGTGYSSLSHLHRLPFDSLKIDRSFVMAADQRAENKQILLTIISLANNLNLRTIAEGIETEEQLRLLQDLKCDFGQGYLFSKPLPKDEVENLLYKKSHWLPQAEEIFADDDLTQDITEGNVHIF
jgi:diguanylate cyclase (GGDEF)-like protein